MNTDGNLVGYLAQNLAALSANAPWNHKAQCVEPTVSERDAGMALSTAELVQDDIANALQVVGQLLVSYPDDIGDERERLPQVGKLLRVLGGTLDLANEAAALATSQLSRHYWLSGTKPVEDSQAEETRADIYATETLRQIGEVIERRDAEAQDRPEEEQT
ncbi:hypothetical protein [Chromobacterium sp. IIBBL 290-4]|uniref:hypothetical protein n=1 Tax=Chromobacterium sp. IIBBL 290-4 TaxID=2953890 RepID=UPI0020B81C3D|nr:hypothetical protein [Chromobacterium sp. IIBBL 290-4]UTH72232.1 hypothetical protein NKT35_11760 [Chromobacterium sp. IIBBL 290-4]